MKTKNNLFWKNLIHIICWVIFIGCCIQTGVLVFNYIYSLFNPNVTKDLYLRLNLAEVYAQNRIVYSFVLISLILLSAIKAFIFYFVLKLFKFFQMERPFTITITNLIHRISYITAIAAFFNIITKNIILKLSTKGYNLDQVTGFMEDSSTYIIMSVILIVISMIFRKGLELQTENDLTL